jgi:hypothetical protein
MPDAKRSRDLMPAPDPAELLAAKAAGLSLVAWRARKTGVALESDDVDNDRLEKAEQLEVQKVFRAFGGRVYSLSQARASKQTPGLGDLFVVFPELVSFWFETKRQKGGRVSEAQQEFHDLCNRTITGSRHYIGGRREAEDLVIALEIAYRDTNGALEPVRCDDGPYALPEEFDDDDNEHDFTEEDLIT